MSADHGSIENALLIVVDALRMDRSGAHSEESLTPEIDSLAEEGEVFDKCYSCINATDSSMTTILSGQYPTRHGVLNHGGDVTQTEREHVSGVQTLPELVNDSKKTIAVDMLERWHKRGFDEYTNPLDSHQQNDTNREKIVPVMSKATGHLPNSLEKPIKSAYSRINSRYSSNNQNVYPSGDRVTDAVINAIRDSADQWFGLVHYWDPHLPYCSLEDHPEIAEVVRDRRYEDGTVPIDSAFEPIAGSNWHRQLQADLVQDSRTIGEMKRKYDAGVRFADEHIGRLIRELKEREEYEETAIIITADHGENLTEHGIFFDHHGLYDTTTHVPFIIHAPGFEGREEQFVQHFDIVPTLLDLFGCDYDPGQFDGCSLIPDTGGSRTLDREAAYMEEGHVARKRAVRTDSYRYIKNIGENNYCRYCGLTHALDRELYDVASDPAESKNIVRERPGIAEELDEQLESWVGELADPGRGAVEFEEDKKVLDRLDSMGYI